MARRRNYHHSHTGLRVFCVILALMLAAGLTLGGLELWGKGKMKPSNWFKSDLAPVTITLADAPAPALYGARAYALDEPDSYPSTKRATATCTLPEGGSPERYEWKITGGEGLSVQTVNADGSAADVTAQQYFPGTATLTARAYRGNELRGIGSISIYAREPEPEPLPALSLLLFSLQNQTAQYQYALETIKNEVLPATAEEVDLQEITMDPNSDSIKENIGNVTESETDLIVIFDNYGTIVNGMDTASFDLLSDKGLLFVVIDNAAYAAEEVEAAGGYYLTTADFYDTGDARAALDEWNTYGQEIALKYHTPGAAETAFDAFIDELFDYSAQEFGEDQLGDLYQQYAFEYDVIVCVDGAIFSSIYSDALDVTWIINDYYCEEGYDPQEEIYAEYPDLGNAIVYQRQLNGRGIIKAIIGLANGEEISELFAYERVRVL